MKKFIILLLSLSLATFSLTGCNLATRKIVYTVYPIGFILESLTKDTIILESIQNDSIIQRATIADDYESVLEGANLFIQIGNLEPYLSIYSSIIRNHDLTVMDLSLKNSVYSFKRYTRGVVEGVEVFTEGDYYKGDVFSTIDTNSMDLALWIDPISMVSMAREIKNWLQLNYPEDSAFYEANFAELESNLILLDADFTKLSTELKSENKTIKFVSMTASFGNWQKTYGIQVYPIILSKYGSLPNDQQLEIIKQRIIDDEVKYIAYEPNMTEDMIELYNKLVEELKLERINLSNLSSISETEKLTNMNYITIMYENLAQLQAIKTDIINENGAETNEDLANEGSAG